MQYVIGTRYAPCTVELVLKAKRPFTARIQVSDSAKEHTLLINRTMPMNIGSVEQVLLPLPLTTAKCTVNITDDSMVADGSSFEVVKIRIKSLLRQMDVAGFGNQKTRSFVRFAQKFCYNAGWLPTNSDTEYYCSDDGEFRIKYLPIINDGGQEVTTPARINKVTKVIEVSKRKFIDLTVPERLCILLHEYSHMFVNIDQANELEADLNGLTIYLALGYPRNEAFEVFIKTFYSVPTDANMKRYQHIEDFITNFDRYFFGRKAA